MRRGALAVDSELRAGAGAGVLVRQEGKGHWAALKRAFRLLVDDVDDQSPTDAAYVFSGHCPLTVRRGACACSGSVRKRSEPCAIVACLCDCLGGQLSWLLKASLLVTP